MVTGPATPSRATSVRAGVVVALLVAALALVLLITRPQHWSATSSLLVLPKSGNADQDLTAGLYDVLSRGQVPATYAELLRDRSLEVEAAEQEGLTTAEVEDVSLEVLVVPDTSVLDLKVTAESAAVAETIATSARAEAEAYLSALDTPYKVVAAGDATGTARREGLSPLPLVAVVCVVVAVAGLGVQQAVMALSRARGVGVDSAERPVPVTLVGERMPGPEPPESGQVVASARDTPDHARNRR